MSHQFLERIQATFPDLRIDDVTVNTEGLVNDVVVVNHHLVCRFPKTQAAQIALCNESRILDRVRLHVDTPVPALRLHEGDFSTHEMIQGEPLLRDDILRQSEAVQTSIADQLARFLRQLHAVPIPDLPIAQASRTREQWLRLYDDTQRELFPLMMKHTQRVVHQIFAPLVADAQWLEYEPCLIHGDVAQYHILVDWSQSQITGVIDFGVAGLGDPATDIGLIINVYGETLLGRMVGQYPALIHLLDRARFYAAALELQWLLGGLRSGDLSWFTVSFDRARDRLAYGTVYD